MKFTDKFVLVPIERYNQLTKDLADGNFNKGNKSEDLSSSSQDANKLYKENKIHESHAPEKEKQITFIDDIEQQRGKGKLKKLKSPLNKSSKIKKVRKTFPRPPPGIPNKIKKSDFKWFKIF